MPLVDDYSKDEEDDATGLRGGGVAGSGGGAASAAPSKQREPEFVPWSRFVSANEGVSQREAGKLQSQVQGSVDKAVRERNEASERQTAGISKNYNQPAQQPFGSISSFGKPAAPSLAPSAARPAAQMPTRTPAPVQPTGNPKDLDVERAAHPVSGVNPDALTTTVGDGGYRTDPTPFGAKDLEGAIGKDAWQSLVGDTMKAQQQAKSLGSTSGVQALLGPNATGFDAALVGGAGGKGFQDLSKQYGGGALSKQLVGANESAQGQWSKLMGDLENAGMDRDKQIREANDLMRQRQAADAATATGGATPGGPAPWRPEGYDDLDSFLRPDVNDFSDVNQNMHQAGLALSPADWVTRGLGELGYNGKNATEMFGDMYSGGAFDKDWWTANMRTALDQVMHEYGREAAEAFWNGMTPEMWAAYQKFGNSGAMAREMRAWLESSGFKKMPSTHDQGSQGKQSGVSTGEAEHGTTDEQEAQRTQAYRDGWGEEWDRQWREGNKNPQRSG